MIEFLLLDLDDTILDFHKAERIALSKTIRSFGIAPTEAILNRYMKSTNGTGNSWKKESSQGLRCWRGGLSSCSGSWGRRSAPPTV